MKCSHTNMKRTPTWSSDFSSANQLSSKRATVNIDFIDFSKLYIYMATNL